MARIVDTYSVFVQTCDEGAHVAAGMEWLDRGTYTYETQHPPLRAVFAVGPYLHGIRSSGEETIWAEGNRILYAQDHYGRNLSAARVGALPFFLILGLAVWSWSKELFGPGIALVAVALVSTQPVVLAHAGVATTDILLAATYMVALIAFVNWLGHPTLAAAAGLGAASGLAVLSKFSAFLFLATSFGAVAVGSLFVDGGDRRNRMATLRAVFNPSRLGLVALTASLVVWTGYRGSFAAIGHLAPRPHAAIDEVLADWPTLQAIAYTLIETPVPAPELMRGLQSVRQHMAAGHTSFFRGEISQRGSFLFFPVAILVKSPIPFLLLVAAGMAAIVLAAVRDQNRRRALAPVLAALAILVASLPVPINIGVRHVLPIFPLLAIVAAAGVGALWRCAYLRHVGRVAALLLLGWNTAISVRTHPDYLAYFNEFAADHPERVLVDSDLDWGQDLKRLGGELRRRHIEALHLAYFGSADPARHGLPHFEPLEAGRVTGGWIAISEMRLALGTGEPPYDQYRWLSAERQVARVGKSMRLYHIE